jgi:DNA-binding NarL/FixJ family response regulator
LKSGRLRRFFFTLVQKKRKIAIIDEHPVFVSLLADLLRHKLDFTVVGFAHSGQEGLKVCAKAKPDLVMIDMTMPGMSGLELIRALRRDNPGVLVLAISGAATKELIHMAFMAGANRYFSKARSIEELLQTLGAMSEGRTEMTPEEADALRWAVRERRLRSEISPRDLELLRLFADELPVKEIAERTGRTASGVYKALRRIRQRLDTRTDRDLRLAAKRLGLEGPTEAHQ